MAVLRLIVTAYGLGTAQDGRQTLHKTELVSRHPPLMDITAIQLTAQDYIEAIDSGSAPLPRVVLGAGPRRLPGSSEVGSVDVGGGPQK